MRIFTKLLIVFLALTMIPVIFVSYMIFYNAKNVMEKEALSSLNMEAFQPIEGLKRLCFIVIFTAAISTAISALVVARSISAPIQELRKGAEVISSGNLDYRVGTDTKDEVGQLSRSFDSMVAKLKTSITSIKHLDEEVVERKEAEKALAAHARQQEAIANLGQLAIKGVELQELFDEVVKKIAQVLEVEFCKVLEILPDKTALLLRAGVGWKEGLVGRATVDIGLESQAGFTLQSKKPVIMEDMRTETRFHGPALLYDHHVISGMSVILGATEKPFGVLSAHTVRRRTFTKLDINFLQSVANLLAGAVERKKAEEKLIQFLKKEAKSREIVTSMLSDNNQIREKLEQRLEELKRAQNMIIQSEKLASLGKLASEIAHEVNNPLMIISGNAQLSMASESLNAEVKNNLRIIMEECQSAKNILQRLIKFSKPSKGKIEDVDINKSLEAVVNILERQFKPSGVEIKREYGDNLTLIPIDEELIREVFINLMSNAKDAMLDGGTITVKTFREGDCLGIDFKDTGSGMSEETKKRLLEPFFTTKENGTGLGLSICYGIIRAHGGELRFESQLDMGTTATVLLPLEGGGRT